MLTNNKYFSFLIFGRSLQQSHCFVSFVTFHLHVKDVWYGYDLGMGMIFFFTEFFFQINSKRK